MTAPRNSMRLSSDVSNTLLMKQDTPMLKTNGNVNAREVYSTSVGSLVILASRNFSDRIPFGFVKVSQTILFAGLHKPGVAGVLPSSKDDELAEKDSVIEDKDR